MNVVGMQRSLVGGGKHILDYLKRLHSENSNFYYAVQGDHTHLNANIFWADVACRSNYSCFGDTVVFDNSYSSNGYKVPFATFTGVNHHGQPVLFGCALLSNESEAAYIWLLQTWLESMSGQAPVSITTEPDRFVQMAVEQVLPNVRFRYCKWSMFKETESHMSDVEQGHPNFKADFRKCIDECETIEEFESGWRLLLEKYYLMDDEWLQSVYDARHQWVPVYLRDTFFGELPSSVEGRDGRNIFFDGFVTASTTIQQLIKQYEKAVASWLEKELKADDETINTTPLLKTPSPMEKQAASTFTKKIFTKFQDELVETMANPATKLEESGDITTFRVAKFGEEHKAHVVSYSSLAMKANCSCHLFEFSGIICRHILAVFRAKNVLTLPPEYVLRRWTRDAKSGATSDKCTIEETADSIESNARFSSLREVALKFVEEGAKSVHVYNVALDAVREAAKKVAAVKNEGIRVVQGDSLANGDNQEASGQSAEAKAKKIQELTAKLDNTNKRCEFYRANLLDLLKDMEDQKLKLSVKVENARLSLKE